MTALVALLALASCSSGGEAPFAVPPGSATVTVADTSTPATVAPTVASAPATSTTSAQAPPAAPTTAAGEVAPGRVVTGVDTGEVTTEPVELSAAQQAERDGAGPPSRFTILFLSDTAADGTVIDVRHEVWNDDRAGERLVFRNGERFRVDRDLAPLERAELGATPYRPEWFRRGMSVEQVLSVTGESSYYELDVADSIAGGTYVALAGLIAGFVDGRLAYVEAVPLQAG